MKSSPKLKSFTLLEITIAMVLLAIIAGFAFYILKTFVNLSQDQQTKKLEKYHLSLFMHRLQLDWDHAESITFWGNNLSLKDTTGIIIYQFDDVVILRHQYALRTDSFFLATQEIFTESIAKLNYSASLVNRLHLLIDNQHKIFPIDLHKNYSAKQLLDSTKSIEYDTD